MRTGKVLGLCRNKPAGFGVLIVAFFLLLAAIKPLMAEEEQTANPAPAGEGVEQPQNEAMQALLEGEIEAARKAVAADPSSVTAQVALGELLLKYGTLEEAEKAFDEALKLDERCHETMTGKGVVLARMGKEQQAEEMLQKALLLNPNPVRTFYELGFLYEKRGDFDKAIDEYKKGIEKFHQGRK